MKKHLVFVSNEFAKDKGGIQNMCFLLSDYLADYYDETIICSLDSVVTTKHNVRIIRSKYTSKQFSGFRRELLNILLQLNKNKKIDCILASQYSLCTGCFILKTVFHVPYIIMAHGNEVFGDVGNNIFKSIILNSYRKLIFKTSNIVFANSKFTKSLVVKIYSKANVVVISPPVDSLNSEIVQNIESNGEKTFKMFTIARHVERKGIQLVLQSMPDLIEKNPYIHYYIGGNGEYTPNLKKIVKDLCLEKNVTFLGEISENDKKKYLSECDLFVMPSFSQPSLHSVEGFGIAYLEANSFGKFVIGAKSGGIPDAIWENHTGFLAEENDVSSLVACIGRFFSTDFHYNPIECYEWAMKHSINVIGNKYFQKINEIIYA